MQLAEALWDHIDRISELTGNGFEMYDELKKRNLMLYPVDDFEFAEPSHPTSENSLCLSVEMISHEDDMYVIDFDLEDIHSDYPFVRQAWIRSENESPRYIWVRQGDYYIRRPVQTIQV